MLHSVLAVSLLVGGLMYPAPRMVADDHPVVAQVKEKLKDHNKPFTLGIRAKVKEGMGEKLEAAFAPARKLTLKEKGCLAYDLNKSADDETVYIVYERWANLAALEAHIKTPHTEKLLGTIHEYLDGPPEIRVFLVVGE
jgi:autoinducer 2-degrading protein